MLRSPLPLLVLLAACSEYDLGRHTDPTPGVADDDPDGGEIPWSDLECPQLDFDPEQTGTGDTCDFDIGGFAPIVEWSHGKGKHSNAGVAVADLDGDGLPEIVANIVTEIMGTGSLVVVRGDGSGLVWERDARIGYGAAPAVGDLDADGSPEIVVVREYATSMMATGDYTVVAYDAQGNELWESGHFVGLDFDYATAPIISDMDKDGFPEIIVGRVILSDNGETRGVGAHGRGSYGITEFFGMTISEASIPAVVDLDLDGVEEVVVGNAMYGPDGETLWHDPSADDGMIAIANLDADAEGEFLATTGATVRAVDTDGTVLWGPVPIPGANILSVPSAEDVDGDGWPEIVVAGGNWLYVLKRDGSLLWRASVTDESGATGASFFDFEGDGKIEIVYVDEVQIVAYDGATGAVKFQTNDHASNTMMDYPVIADVDADGHAEIVVAHFGHDRAFSVYGDANDSWAPARKVWNQHAYSVVNVRDDLSIPTDLAPGFTTYNSWHSAMDREPGEVLTDDLEGEILDVCEQDCDAGVVIVYGRLLNRSDREVPAGVPLTLYARIDGRLEALDTVETKEEIPGGWSSAGLAFEADASLVAQASALWLAADDAGAGGGIVAECSETNNGFEQSGAFCQ